MIALPTLSAVLPDSTVYPSRPAERDTWIRSRRGAKNRLDHQRPYAYLYEEETGVDGLPVPTATIFLTNRECPYRCLMCDLWQNTLDETTPPGAIAEQIRFALSQLPAARQIKLYNAGSFFDSRAIPPEEYSEIAETIAGFERVIVECHPRLIGPKALEFRALLAGTLEIAVGLETVHPEALARLNKRFTVDDFLEAAAFLRENSIDLRVFVLLRPPFLGEEESVLWAMRTLEVAFDAGAGVCCVIPTRGGNGAMEALAQAGEYHPPTVRSLERAVHAGIGLGKGRVFADLWDIERFFDCDCSPLRAARLERINRMQRVPDPVECLVCQ